MTPHLRATQRPAARALRDALLAHPWWQLDADLEVLESTNSLTRCAPQMASLKGFSLGQSPSRSIVLLASFPPRLVDTRSPKVVVRTGGVCRTRRAGGGGAACWALLFGTCPAWGIATAQECNVERDESYELRSRQPPPPGCGWGSTTRLYRHPRRGSGEVSRYRGP